ncbi:hypothetical protein [Actinopolymorpha pittospori]|uniref:DUF3024 domain-containing protein n=1 Tax=Actinopolymorpha pittospori TaxID=648752 RepID=A0A927RID0_9ACTN|nr:hypothetical protein [Actinopolymorpha pittospori]MBE1604413.1 hypothetical protein [Actinopolymorpha pittospori]
MSLNDALGAVEARLAARRDTSEQYARKLQERLDGLYETKLYELGETWAVQVRYPEDRTTWLTIRCVMYDDRPKWEWSRWLRSIADGDDFEAVVAYLGRLFAGDFT